MTIFLFLLFCACWDGAKAMEANQRRSKGGSRMKRAAMLGTLLLANEVHNSDLDKSFLHCPQALPKQNMDEMFRAIACSNGNDNNFQKYLVDNEEKCGLRSMYEKTLDSVAECAYGYSMKIVEGAKSLIQGKSANHVEMLRSYLEKFLYGYEMDMFDLENIDFFQFLRIHKYTQAMNPNKPPIYAVRLALDAKYQDYDFDKVDRAYFYTQKWLKNEPPSLAAFFALDAKYQWYDFDEVDELYVDDLKRFPKHPHLAAMYALDEKYNEKYQNSQTERHNKVLEKMKSILGKHLGERYYQKWTKDEDLTLEDIEKTLQNHGNKPPTANLVFQKIIAFKREQMEQDLKYYML